MDTFLKATAGILIVLILNLMLAKQNKDFSLLSTIAVCCFGAIAAISYLQPIIQFFTKLQVLGQLNTDMLQIILKSIGIALLAEIAGHICTDANNASLGKILQLLATSVILWMSVPLFTGLIDLIEKILGSI